MATAITLLLAIGLGVSPGAYGDDENVEAITLSGNLTFSGWANAAAVDSTGSLTFKGWGDSVPSSPENTLVFRGWGMTTGAQSPVTLSFAGWGGGAMPTVDDPLAFRGWGNDIMPEAEGPLAFHGWGDNSMPTAESPLAFRGWGDGAVPALAGVLAFKGLDPLPYPCHPDDLTDGEFVQLPVLNPGNNHYYERFTCETDWQTAAEACQSVGAHLVTVGSEAESEYVSAMAADCSGSGCWIGATDVREEGTFAWVTGEPWTTENWASGEPNNSCDGEHFAHITYHGNWNDQAVDGSCHTWGLMQYICEWSEAR